MPNNSEIQSASRLPRLRLRYLFGIIVAALALPIVFWLAWGWIEAARLDRALDALEARHEPLDIADFDAKPTTPEQREASHLYAAAYQAVTDQLTSTLHTMELGKAIEELCSPSARAVAHTAAIQQLRAFEEPYIPAFKLLDRATALDAAGWDDADRPALGSVQDMRSINLGRANVVRIARLACSGEGEGAATALLAMLRLQRLGNSFMRLPLFQTPHSLHALLTFGGASPALLERIQNEYTAAADARILENRISRARAYWLSWMLPGVFSDNAESGSRRITPVEGILRKLLNPLRHHRIVAELHEFDEATDAADQPWPGKLDALRGFAGNRPRGSSQRQGMLDALTQPFGRHAAANMTAAFLESAVEILARARASIGAVAVARYRSDHPGAMPKSLQSLIPAYLQAPLIDPYTGAELQYRVEGAAYKVYSVGINRKDDGGTWELHSDLQWARRGNPPDIGIAVTPSPGTN